MARWGLAAVAIGIVVGATVPAAVDGLADGRGRQPRRACPGSSSALFAFLAYVAMTGSVIYGLLLSTRLLDAIAHRPISFALHQDLAAIGLGLAGIHGILLGLDHTVPFSLRADPRARVSRRTRRVAVAFGQVALYLMAIVTAQLLRAPAHRPAGLADAPLRDVPRVRRRDRPRHRGRLRQHAPWAEAIYLVSAALVLFLFTYRIGMSMATRPRSHRTPAAGGVAEVRTGGRYLPVARMRRDSDPRRLRPASVRDGGPLRRNPANPLGSPVRLGRSPVSARPPGRPAREVLAEEGEHPLPGVVDAASSNPACVGIIGPDRPHEPAVAAHERVAGVRVGLDVVGDARGLERRLELRAVLAEHASRPPYEATVGQRSGMIDSSAGRAP